MNYPDSVHFLYALGNEIKTAKLGLERIGTVLDRLGRPQDKLRIVHVAGTNGKGSTCAMIESALRVAPGPGGASSGRRTGLFTSPHLAEPTERIRMDGEPLPTAQFTEAFDRVHRAVEELLAEGAIDFHTTYFETVTAMALVVFAEERTETVVLEVGLGGRLDATNVVSPELCVITPVDFDHEVFLGKSLESIAAEKAGILKAGVPAVFSRQRPEAERVLDLRAAELSIPVARTAGWTIADLELDARGSRFSGIECPLAGEHQVDNAVTAALALETLGVSPKGIAETRWPGRLEHISPNPDILLDGAHNPAGVRALIRYLERFYPDRKRWIIFGAMRDKAVAEMGTILFPLADELILTAADSPRYMTPEELAALAAHGRAVPNIGAALKLVASEASADDMIVITGSLFLVGEARAASYNRNSWPFSGAWS